MEKPVENLHGHAVHFLQRLERASGEASELALRLYHDPQMLRAVLAHIRIPEQFDRTALSLHEEDVGPYLVASREGRFITCLGRDMTVQNLHVIPYSQLLAYIHKTEQTRERWALGASLVGGGRRQMTELVKRIAQKGDDVTREEFLAVSAIQPIVAGRFFSALFTWAESYGNLYGILRGRKKFGEKEEPYLKDLWNRYWAAGHFALLASMSGMRELERVVKDIPSHLLDLLVILASSGNMAMTARLLWFIGKIGPSLLPECKRMICEPGSAEAWILGCFGAAVIGIRHSKTKSKVADMVFKSLKGYEEFPRSLIRLLQNAKCDEVFRMVLGAIEYPEKTDEAFVKASKEEFFSALAEHPKAMPKPYQWNSFEEIPDGTSVAFTLSLKLSFFKEPQLLRSLGLMLPILARCEAEDFYFSNDFYQYFKQPWRAADTISLFESEIEGHGANRPIQVEETPGRNDLCPCGSGKKYKKCCLQ